MQKRCEVCDRAFEARRATTRFCGQACQKRAKRAQRAGNPAKGAKLVALPTPPADPESDEGERPDSLTPIAAATLKQLEAAGRLDTPIGVAALAAAYKLDVSMAETGSSYASLLKGYREALAEAMKDAQGAEDPIDKIRESAALKLIAGGKQ